MLAACRHAPAPAARSVAKLAELAEEPSAPVLGVVEQTGAIFVFTRAGASVVRGGAAISGDALAHLTATPGEIAAPGGGDRWVLSSLMRVLPTGDVEPIDAARLGLPAGEDWRFAGAGDTFVARSAAHLAVSADGRHVAIYPAPPPDTQLAVALGRVALAGASGLEVWDLAAGTRRTFALHRARIVFVDAAGAAPRLAAWVYGRLSIEGADGALHAVAAPGPIRGAAASGARLWVIAGHALAFVEPGQGALTVTTLSTAHVAHPDLFGSPSGDVWLATAGSLARYGLAAAPAADARWTADMAPVFARVCAACHLPDGSAGVDLSTAARWHEERAEIGVRVVRDRSMPPAGTAISDEDRAAIGRWVDAR